MNVTVTGPSKGEEVRGGQAAPPDLAERIRETVQLMDRRGYGVKVEDFARLLYGGSQPPAAVARELDRMPEISVEGGLVVRHDRKGEEARIRARQATHLLHAAEAEALAYDFAARLRSSCPLVESVSLTGSMASGGFDPGDDVDLNLIARDGSKYTVYLWALALSAVSSLRNRKKQTDEMSALPFLPKIICINVVWEQGQLRPFARQDKWIAYELLIHKPILGAAMWREVLRQNRWMAGHFPQVYEADFVGPDVKAAVQLATKRRAGRRFFEFLARHPGALAAVEGVSRVVVIALHRVVSLTRVRKPEAREREAFVNLVKRPYSVYDVPGREIEVPAEALKPRAPDASPLR